MKSTGAFKDMQINKTIVTMLVIRNFIWDQNPAGTLAGSKLMIVRLDVQPKNSNKNMNKTDLKTRRDCS